MARSASPVPDLSRLHMLELLSERPRHGYEIMEELQRRTKRRIRPSAVYPFLKALTAKSYVSHKIQRTGRRTRKVYHLTKRGSDLCRHLFDRFENLVSIAIRPRIQACAHCGCGVYEGGHEEKIRGIRMVFCCRYCAASYRGKVKVA